MQRTVYLEMVEKRIVSHSFSNRCHARSGRIAVPCTDFERIRQNSRVRMVDPINLVEAFEVHVRFRSQMVYLVALHTQREIITLNFRRGNGSRCVNKANN